MRSASTYWRGRPRRLPFARALRIPAQTRSQIKLRSIWATAETIVKINADNSWEQYRGSAHEAGVEQAVVSSAAISIRAGQAGSSCRDRTTRRRSQQEFTHPCIRAVVDQDFGNSLTCVFEIIAALAGERLVAVPIPCATTLCSSGSSVTLSR